MFTIAKPAVLALTAALAVPFCAAPVLAADQPATMNLTGTATIEAVPDMATLSSGVVAQAKTAREALTQNTAAMTKLVDILKSAGIAAKDIQTSNFSVSPQYVHSRNKDENGYTLPPKIVGYQVSNQVSVKVRDLTDLGTVLDKMVSAGSNTIGGIGFSVSDSAELENRARVAAMKDALDKARLYADTAGVCLVRITSISESGGARPVLKIARAMTAMAEAAPVPVEAGEVSYAMSVNVGWEIGQAPCK